MQIPTIPELQKRLERFWDHLWEMRYVFRKENPAMNKELMHPAPPAPEAPAPPAAVEPPRKHTSDESLMRIGDALERIASAMEEKNKANGNGKHK
jgi:hypothetical protein